LTRAEAQQRAAAAVSDETELVARLRAGDERVFESLVREYYPTMLAVARTYVRTRAVAEEVVQEAWVGVLRGLDRFEGRSSLKTWVTRIVVNTAKTRGVREARSVPFSALAPEGEEASVHAERFRETGDGFPGHWQAYPADWGLVPEERLLGRETLEVAMRAIEELPPAQRTVITLRDLEGWDSEEVCDALDVSAVNQRVLLHRARSRVRAALESHLDD
jgi:RNA polymerase sigma-70 factor, ECF subfamily